MAFPQIITTVGQSSLDGVSENIGSVGPFEDGATVRYIILQDYTAFKMRAYRSADSGATWAEVDAANAPSIANDTASPAPSVYQFYSVARDATPAVRKLYAVYWHTNFTIRLITFNMATQTWGAMIGSALTYRFAGLPGRYLTGFGVAHRAADNVVWMMFTSGIDGVTPVANRVSGAKCDLTGAAWGPLVALGTTNNLDIRNWEVVGMVKDSANKIHLFFLAGNDTGIANPTFPESLFHQVIQTNDTLTVPDLIVSTAFPDKFNFASYPSISTGDELLFTYFPTGVGPTFVVHAVRALAADAPVWSNEVPPGSLQNFTNFIGATFKGTCTLAGLDYIFFNGPPVAGNVTYAFITSPSIPGSVWSAETVLGTVPLANVFSGPQPNAFPSVPSWAITINYNAAPVPFVFAGQAYFENAAAAPCPPSPGGL